MMRVLKGFLLFFFGSVALVLFLMWGIVVNPFVSEEGIPSFQPTQVSKSHLRSHIQFLTTRNPARNFTNLRSLNESAEYIADQWKELGLEAVKQSYQVQGNEYHNVITRLGPQGKSPLVIGAHYDVYGEFPGANDNASGVAVLIELVRSLQARQSELLFPVEFVAYSLEEPPFFRTENMGSAVHAKSLVDRGVLPRAMLSLETLGYYSDKPNSQSFPVSFLKYIYPTTADFVAVVGDIEAWSLTRKVKSTFRRSVGLKTVSINAPFQIQGIDFSDHLNYARYGIPAVMITDTAFFRSSHYHTAGDTIDILSFNHLVKITQALQHWILSES